MNDTTLPGFTPQPPMFEAPVAPPAAGKRRGRPPGTGRAARKPAASAVPHDPTVRAKTGTPAKRRTTKRTAAPVRASPKSLTELTFGVDAKTAGVLEGIVSMTQTLSDDARKAVIAALQRVFP